MSDQKHNGHVPAALLLGIALIVCAFVVRSTILTVRSAGRTIAVTGAAFKPITSDYAVWDATLQVSSPELATAYAKLKTDLEAVQQFMADMKLTETDYEVGGVMIGRRHDREGRPTDYQLSLVIKVELADVPRITEVAKGSSKLFEQGIELVSHNPRYMYTKLEDVKIEMIRAATENAKLRAQQLAETTGREVGPPVSARVGVFQIRPRNSQEVSDYGINDVSAIEKEIVCTVQISFIIE